MHSSTAEGYGLRGHAEQCVSRKAGVQCKGAKPRDDARWCDRVFDFHHHYSPEGNNSIDIGEGRKMCLPNFDPRQDEAAVFCSPKCLTVYVMDQVAPDALGDDN